MKTRITREARDVALLRVLRRHQLTRPHDRLLYGEMAQAWTREIGVPDCDLLASVDRLVREGVFLRHPTAAGDELELSERGARAIRWPDSVVPAQPSALARLIGRIGQRWKRWLPHSGTRAKGHA